MSQGEVIATRITAQYKHHLPLQVTYSSDAPASLPRKFIVKYYDHQDSSGRREGQFYHKLAPAMPNPPVPPCYDVSIDEATGRIYILLKDLSATHFVPRSGRRTPATYARILDAYLACHIYWWEHPRIAQADFLQTGCIGVSHEATSPAAIRDQQRYFAEHALPRWVDRYHDRLSQAWRTICEKSITAWADVFIQRMADGRALTVIQGDAQVGNILLPRNPHMHQPVIIDWEGCTRGIGVWDIARMLIAAELPVARRQAFETILLPHYHARLVESGVERYSLQDCYNDYRLCVLANILHALEWQGISYFEAALHAFKDWDCAELLD